MKGTVFFVIFCFIFSITKTQEVSRGFASSDADINLKTGNNIEKGFQPSTSYAFKPKNYNTTLERPPSYVYSKWLPGMTQNMNPIEAASDYNLNATNGNTTNIFDIKLIQDIEDTENGSLSNSTNSLNFTFESRNNLSGYRKKNKQLYSKGITHYFWDSVYVLFSCFREHWTEGVIDCVTARATTILDGLFGMDDKHNELLSKDVFGLFSHETDLEETPRQDIDDDGMPLSLVDEGDEEEEAEDYEQDEGTAVAKDSREGEIS